MSVSKARAAFLLFATSMSVPGACAEVRIERDPPELRDIRLMASRYAGCIHSVVRNTAAKLLATAPDDPQFARVLSRMKAGGTCGFMRSGIPFTPELTRGYLMEFAYWRDFAETAPTALSSVPAIDYDANHRSEGGVSPRAQIAIARFGDCLARARPAESINVLKFLPGSGAEAQALAILSPNFSSCVPQGQTVHLTPATLRAAIASGLYYLGKAVSERKAS